MKLFLSLILSVLLAFEADFRQVKHVPIMKTDQVATGHMVYRSPDYIRWQYFTPQSCVWEMDGKKSNVAPPVQRLLQMVMNTISGNYLQDNEQFSVSRDGNKYILKPKKKEMLQFFREIHISLNPKTQIADEVLLIEKEGSTTRIIFSNVKK